MVVTVVNFAPFAQEAKAAGVDVYVLFNGVTSNANPKIHAYGNGYDLGWIEPSTFSEVNTSTSGTWYKTTINNYSSLNNCPMNIIINAGGDNDGKWVTVTGDSSAYYIVRTTESSTQVTEDVARNTYGLGGGGSTEETTAPAQTSTTITFVSQNSGIQESDARIYVIEGTINSGDYKDGANVMTKGTAMTETTDGTWTATVTSDVITFVRVSKPSDGNYYWGWQWENTARGNNTVFTATGNGEGSWSGGSSETTTEAAKPDVVVTDITWSPASPKAGDAVTFTATIKNQGTVATPAGKTGVAFTVNGGNKTWNGDYTTSIPAGGTITLTANNGENGTSWTASEGTFSVVATIDSTGYTESDTSNNSFTKNITVAAAAPTTFTFTFKDGTDSGWLSNENPIYRVVVDGTTYTMSGGSGTWTATIPTNASSITVNRINPAYPDTAPWNSWQIDGNSRGTNTVYTADGNGTGRWGESTEQPTQPSTQPTGDIYGTPFTELQSWDMSQLELEQIVDKNTANPQELYVVPATFYNYKSGGGSDWWNQFNSLNAAIVDRYYGTGKMEYPLLIGAPDSMWISGDAQGQRPLSNMMNGKVDENITNMLALFYINHNLTGDGNGGTNNFGGGSSPVQGLVAEYMDSNTGSLLSAENNVLMPYFDDSFLGTTGDGNVIEGTWATKYGSQWARLSFPFRKVGNFYVFDSASGLDNIYVENGKVTYDSSDSARVRNGFASSTGFYPFDTSADSGNAAALTYGFGARLDIPFNVVNKTDDEQDNTNMLMSGSAAFSDGGPKWNELTLDQTLQPGTYQLRLVHDGGGFAFTQYKAGGADSGQHAHGFDNHKDTTVAGYQSYGDIDGGREALNNLKAPIVQTIEVTEATNKISFYGKLWGTQNFSAELYANDATIVPPSGVDNDIVFNFSGDDDLWIYVDGKLALDIGGSHGQASGSINFTDGTITVNDRFVMNYNGGDDGKGWLYGDNRSNATTDASWLKFDDPNETHVMTVFYMERGLYDSNLSISYNFIPVDLTQKNGLTVENEVDLSEVNDGFNLKENDFSFNYDVYDVTANNNNLLFPNGEITITGNGGKNASLEQDGATGNTIRGDEIKVAQKPNSYFNTSYTLKDTNEHEISSSTGKSDSYNVTDGKNDAGSTSDNTFVLDNLSNSCGCDNSEKASLLVTASFVNKPKVTSIVIGKNDSSVAYDDNNTYTFTVTYSKLLGVERNGFFDGTYVITDTRDGSTKTATTSNGEITIHAYETATITGVPVDSNIKISEKDTGNYIKTVVTDSTGAETTIANDGSYSLGVDETVSYSWTIYNGDSNAVEYFAEVGTQIVINAGDELTLVTNGSASGTTYYDKYIPQVGGMTVTNAPATDAVTGGYDLVVTDVSWISDGVLGGPINVGSVVTWSVTVKNIGDADAPAGEKIGYNINGQMWNDQYFDGLAAGESVVLNTTGGSGDYSNGTFTATNSTTTYTVTVDDSGNFAETNEGNNTYSFSMTTPYAPATTEQVRIDATYTYHETITKVGKVSSTIGTVTLTDGNTITYLYPANSEAGVDAFYYEISRIADSDVVADGVTVVQAGQVISTTTVPAKVYAYAGNDDVYVIDYGLPVSLTAAPNDMRANDITTLDGVVTTRVDYGFVGSGTTLSTATAAKGVYKAAEIGYIAAGNAVYGGVDNYSYKLNKFMDGIETFSYGFQVVKEGTDISTATLNAANATPVINSKVTVVPASIVYYEDNFSYDSTTGTTTAITYTGNGIVYNSTGLEITQSNDLDELYGFDEAYANMIGDSNGSTVLEKSQKVSFTFKGTGFDIVARTADTATVLYVVSRDNQVVTMGNVDTYYDAGVLYQIPVISVEDLEYAEYTVQFMILTSSAYSQFYFDGIRIYNPLGVGGNDYYKPNEYGATVTPIIDMILGDCTFTETGIYDASGNLVSESAGTPDGSQISVVGNMISEDLGSGSIKNGPSLLDILEDGPNEEVYLGNGSKLVFYATKNNEVTNDADRTLQVEVKAVSGDTVLEDVRVDNKSSWVATSSSDVDGKFAIDDDLSTRWHGSYQRSETERKWFQVDMAKEYTFDAINLALGSSSNDWPANYEVFISDNGTDWNSIKSGVGEAGLETIYLGPTTTRYIRIEQWGVRYSNYWSIHEFSLKSAVRNTDPSSKANWSIVDANSDTNYLYRLIDNKLTDRWTSYGNMGSATEANPVYFVVDLGSRYDFDTVQMFLGTSTNDQPDNYKISVSNDNVTWTAVASGAATVGTEEYSVGAQNARYVKVEGWGGGNYWSVHEFGIANKAGVDTGLDLSLNSSKNVIASVDTNTAMYYEIPMNLCTEESTGKYLVVINGASSDDYNLSFTNLKVKGYDITPYTTSASATDVVHITDITVNGSKDISVKKQSEISFNVTLSENADMSKENLALTANGKSVIIRSVKLVEGTSNQYIVKTLAPNAVGTFTYEFAYTNSDGTKAVTSTSVKVTASRSR